jgi:putative spermidine/putrescine transport system substrate-binding protein
MVAEIRNALEGWEDMNTLRRIRRLLLGWMLAAPVVLSVPAQAMGQDLRVLAWPGYADDDVVQAFEQKTGRKVEVTVIDSDAALWQAVNRNGGRDFDVFAVNTAELQRYVAAGLVMPIERKAVPNTNRQLPPFNDLSAIKGLMHGGRLFAVPYTYAEMGLIYDRKQIKEPPRSIRALWDPAYQGKVLAYDGGTHNFTLAAQSLGWPQPFRIQDNQWREAVDRLIDLRRNVAAFYSQPEESVTLFRERKAALMFANYGSQQVKLLRELGLDVGYTVPDEGALAWLDCWAVSRGARDPMLAMAWVDFMLEPQPGQVLLERQGLANTTSPSPFVQKGAKLVWLEPAESEDRRNLLWSRIVSGDRANRVLAP